MPTEKIGRNVPCPCGSGRKSKKCCRSRATGDRMTGQDGACLLDRLIDPGCISVLAGNKVASPDAAQSPPKKTPPLDDPPAWKLVHVLLCNENGERCHVQLLHTRQQLLEQWVGEGSMMRVNLPDEGVFGWGLVLSIDDAPLAPDEEGKLYTLVRHKQTPRQADELASRIRRDRLSLTLELTPRSRRKITLVLHGEGGHRVDMTLIRSVEWLHAHRAVEGSAIYLNLPEQGVEGKAEVLAVEPCAPFPGGKGKPVTGWFRHNIGYPGDLRITGESSPIGVTPNHPFWSMDREDWVSVCDLKGGERVKTRSGTASVISYTSRDKPEPVYNIEVAGDHCYRVGDQGILVHNASAGACKKCEDWKIPVGGPPYRVKAPLKEQEVSVKPEQQELDEPWEGKGKFVYKRDLKGKKYTFPRIQWMSYRFENKTGFVVGFNGRGGRPSPRARVWTRLIVGRPGDIPGHVMTDLLGGPGDLPKTIIGEIVVTVGGAEKQTKQLAGNADFMNLVPLSSQDNTLYNTNEELLKTLVKNNPLVCVRVSFSYQGADKDTPNRPTSYKWEWVYRDDMGNWHEK